MVSNITFFPDAETNLVPWTPLQFFTIAADRMLRDYSQQWLVESPSNYLATYGSYTNISTAANPSLNPTNMPLPFGISNIPVYVNGQFVYTPAVQRVLQLAANIYDATTNNTACPGRQFPFRFPADFFRVTDDPASGLHQCLYQSVTNRSSLSAPMTHSRTVNDSTLNWLCRWRSVIW